MTPVKSHILNLPVPKADLTTSLSSKIHRLSVLKADITVSLYTHICFVDTRLGREFPNRLVVGFTREGFGTHWDAFVTCVGHNPSITVIGLLTSMRDSL